MTTGILLAGFGGPEPGCCGRRPDCPRTPGCEAECFVAKVLDSRPRPAPAPSAGPSAKPGGTGRPSGGADANPAARIQAVAAHYHAVAGGFSPYNQRSRDQALALRRELARRGLDAPVALGFRHWQPWLDQALAELSAQDCTDCIVVPLTAHHAGSGWDSYRTDAEDAAKRLENPIAVRAIVPPLFDRPGLIAALAARVRAATAGWSADRFAAARLIVAAHAVPLPVERSSPYRTQIAATARLLAEALGHPAHALAFQSAPPTSAIPWSSPLIADVLKEAAASGAQDVIVSPAGFLVDHVEVLYDLDVEAQALCRQLGLGWTRAEGVHDHPAFIAAMAEAIAETLAAKAQAQPAAMLQSNVSPARNGTTSP